MKRYRVVNKRRFSIFLICILSIAFLMISILVNSFKAQGAKLKEAYYEHYISEGDTLWDIALRYKPVKYDVRRMVYEIKDFNKMDTSYVFPGQLIKVPKIESIEK